MLCPDRRSLIIARAGECVANSVVFSLRRVFNYCWYVAQNKKKNEKKTPNKERKQTENKKTAVQCVNKVKLNHVHTKCRSHSRESLSASFWAAGGCFSISLFLSLFVCVSVSLSALSGGNMTISYQSNNRNTYKWQQIHRRDTSPTATPLLLAHRSTTWPHGSHFDIKDYTLRRQRAV